jgi:hypothetical protein
MNLNPFRRKKPTLAEPSEAERARSAAIFDLAIVESRAEEVSRITRSLREWRERNHVVAQLDEMFYGGRP